MAVDRFVLPALGVLVVAAAVISQRWARPEPTPGPVRITYWEKWTSFEFDGIKAIVDDFNQSQDRIHVELLSVSNIADKTMMAISGNIPPDVAGLFGANVAQYADDHAVMPLNDFCKEAGIGPEDYVPVFWDMCEYRGKVVCLPSTPATTALHYNTDMFVQAGLDSARPPRTTEELSEYAEKLTIRGKDGKIDRSGFMPAEPGWWNWSWGYYFGGKLWDGEEELTANSPENVRAFEWVQSFSKKYGAAELQTFRSGFGNFSSPQNAFMTEQVGMVNQGVWMDNFVQMYRKGLPYQVAPFPYPAERPELAESTIADMDVLVIPRGAKHPKEAFEFIKYVQTQKAMEKLCLAHAKNSPLAVVSDEFYARHRNPFIRLFDKLARSPNAFAAPQMGIWAEYSGELGNAFDEVVLLKKTPKQALDAVQARMQPRFTQYLSRLRMRGEAE